MRNIKITSKIIYDADGIEGDWDGRKDKGFCIFWELWPVVV